MQSDAMILAKSKRVACDGGVAGHPRVWLTLDGDTKQVVCPYCSRLYASDEAEVWQQTDATPAPTESDE